MDRRAASGSLLRSFERHLRAQNRSERTVGNDLESARRVEVFLEGRGKRLEEATQADLKDFLGDILRHRSANTAATRYKVMRVLYRSRTAVSGLACRACGRPPAGRTG
jgi:hypothetical protein